MSAVDQRRGWAPSGRRGRLAALVIVAAGVATTGIAYSAITDASGVIHGCYKKANGQLRVLAPGTSCRPSELAVSWNQQGPEGPSGPQGPTGSTGDAGPAGPSGPAGVSDYVVVHGLAAASTADSKLARATCPDGEKVLGGGAVISGDAYNNVALNSNGPTTTGWVAVAKLVDGTDPWGLNVYAICARVASSG